MSVSYKTYSAAIKHFLDNTKLRKCKKRDALADQIKKSARPMALANQFLVKFGAKTVTSRAFEVWRLRLVEKRGPFDPVFDGMIAAARAQAEHGTLFKSELLSLEKMLKDSWYPYSDEDNADARKAAADLLAAMSKHDPHEDEQGGS